MPTLRAALLAAAALAAGPALAIPGLPASVAVNPGGGLPNITVGITQLDVTLNATRTLLRYNGFDIAANEAARFRFPARDAIAIVNNIGPSRLTLDGTVLATVGNRTGGNLWFLSASGVLVGPNARIDVGGALFATATPRALADRTGPVLDPAVFRIAFDDTGPGTVDVAAGARITGHGGTLAFVAPVVTTAAGATIGGAGDTAVLYGAADRYVLNFARQAGDDLDLLGFEVTAGVVTPVPLALAGATTAGNIYVAAVSRAEAARALIDASGTLTATDAALEGGAIVLSAGGGIADRSPAPASGAPVDLAVSALGAAGDLTARASGALTFAAPAHAGGRLDATGLAIAAGGLVAGGDLTLRSAGGSLVVASAEAADTARLEASGTLDVETVAAGVIAVRAGGALRLGTATAASDVLAVSDTAEVTVDAATAGDDIRLLAGNGAARLGAATLTGAGPDADRAALVDGALADPQGDGRRIALVARGGAGDTLLGPGAITGATAIDLDAGRDAVADLAARASFGGVAAGRDIRLAAPDLTAGALAATRHLTLTARAGDLDAATLSAGGDLGAIATGALRIVSATAGGDATLAAATLDLGTLTAGRDVTLGALGGDLAAGSLSAGNDLTATATRAVRSASTSAGGDSTLTAATLDIGTLAAGSDVTLDARTGDLDADSLSAGGDLSATAAGALRVADTAAATATLAGATLDLGALTLGGAGDLAATGLIRLGAATTATLRIATGDLDLAGPLVAATLAVATPGDLLLGGATGTGLRLDAAELARLRIAGEASFEAGAGATPGELRVGDFTFDPAALPVITLLAAADSAVRVDGRVLPTVPGGVIRIGDADPLADRRPGAILVSGGFGDATLEANCFTGIVALAELTFRSTGDILFGDVAFQAALASVAPEAIDLARGAPTVAARNDERLFAVATRFSVDTPGTVASQNTTSAPGAFVGLLLGAPGPVDALPLAIAGAPAAVDLSGAVVDAAGALRTGPLAIRVAGLGPGGVAPRVYRLNGCAIGDPGGCGLVLDPASGALRVEDFALPSPGLDSAALDLNVALDVLVGAVVDSLAPPAPDEPDDQDDQDDD